MKSRIFFFGLLLSIFSLSATAQLRHDLGLGFVLGTGKVPAGTEPYDGSLPSYGGWGVHYYPRLALGEQGNFSVGAPLTIGFSGAYNSRSGGNFTIFTDLPLTFDYNFGAGASEEVESTFGGFVGAGFSYTYSNAKSDYYFTDTPESYGTVNGVSYGPVFHGGVRFVMQERLFSVRGFYKIGLEQAKFSSFGASISTNF